jgi:hypothetical protein
MAAIIDNYVGTKHQGTLQDFQNLILTELAKTGAIHIRKPEEETQKLAAGQMEFDFMSELELPIFSEEDKQDTSPY